MSTKKTEKLEKYAQNIMPRYLMAFYILFGYSVNPILCENTDRMRIIVNQSGEKEKSILTDSRKR